MRITAVEVASGKLVPAMPSEPLRSSQGSPWREFIVEHHVVQPGEIPELSPREVLISIQLRDRVDRERWEGGRLQRYWTRAGDMHVIPAGVPRRARWHNTLETLMIAFDPTFLSRLAQELGTDSCIDAAHLALRDPLIGQVGLALKAEMEAHWPGGHMYGESLAIVLGVHLLRNYSSSRQIIPDYKGGLPRFKLRQAIDYINSNIEKNLTLAEIAHGVNMTLYHFARLFKCSTGFSPHQYLIKCRIERAKKLLAETKLPIVEICYRVGLGDQSYFTAQFHRLTGVTPKAYRDSR